MTQYDLTGRLCQLAFAFVWHCRNPNVLCGLWRTVWDPWVWLRNLTEGIPTAGTWWPVARSTVCHPEGASNGSCSYASEAPDASKSLGVSTQWKSALCPAQAKNQGACSRAPDSAPSVDTVPSSQGKQMREQGDRFKALHTALKPLSLLNWRWHALLQFCKMPI